MKPAPQDGWGAAEEASEYYVSITDMIIGLLFLFIILLMYFAFQMRDVTRDQVIAESVRNDLIRRVAERLEAQGVETRTDFVRGTLSLPNELLFARGTDTLNTQGVDAMDLLAEALDVELECFADRRGAPRPDACPDTSARVEAILIEGHTDSDPLAPSARFRDNWDLSSARAASALRTMTRARPGLMDYSVEGEGDAAVKSLFSVAGYADQRPLIEGDSEDAKAANRRIDLRFLMAPPKPPELELVSAGADRGEADGAPIQPGRRLRFSLGRDVDGYLKSGWGLLEDWGVWAIGPSASLVLPIRGYQPDQAYELVLDLVLYVPEASPERRVTVSLNGGPPVDWVLRGPQNTSRQVLALPPGAVAPDGRVEIRFSMENPVSPLEAGQSEDPRRLSIGLHSILVRKTRN